MLRLTIWKAKDCITWELMFLIVSICELGLVVVVTGCFLLMHRHPWQAFGTLASEGLDMSDAAFKH